MSFTPVSTTPVQVFFPQPQGTGGNYHAIIGNQGPYPVYIGGSEVTTVSGLELPPNNQVQIVSAVQGIFAASGFSTSAALAGTTNSAAAQGGSQLTVASGGTAFVPGSQIVIEPGGPRQEIQTVGTSTAGTVTTTAGFAFAHGSAITFNGITPQTAVVYVHRGAT